MAPCPYDHFIILLEKYGIKDAKSMIKLLQKKRVIYFYSNKFNFLKHTKLVKFNQITLLNVNDQNEKIIFLFQNL
jgi:hypothetical protein